MTTKSNLKKSGFVLLYAVLVSGIVLSVGLGLINIFTKQLILSSIGRNSQFAYYAADAGKQCAYFWFSSVFQNAFGVIEDSAFREPVGADDLPVEMFMDDGTGTTKPFIKCQGLDMIVSHNISADGWEVTSDFRLPVTGAAQNSCALIEVKRTINNPGGDDESVQTVIKSSGYNVACEVLANPNPRRIERVVYQVSGS